MLRNGKRKGTVSVLKETTVQYGRQIQTTPTEVRINIKILLEIQITQMKIKKERLEKQATKILDQLNDLQD